MGSNASKAASKAPRKFPTRISDTSTVRQAQSRVAGRPQPSTAKNEAIRSDGMDPDAITLDFSQRLHKMGIVQPQPTFSSTSTAAAALPNTSKNTQPSSPSHPSSSPARNATLTVLEARERLQRRADVEFEGLGRKGSPGREFMDVGTAARVLKLREKGVAPATIEAEFGLRPGVVGRLGPANVVTLAELGRT